MAIYQRMCAGSGFLTWAAPASGFRFTHFLIIPPMPGLAKERVNIVIGSLIVRFMNFHVSACKLNVAFSMRFFLYSSIRDL